MDSPVRVLVVDGDDARARELARSFERADQRLRPEVVTTAADARAALSTFDCDCVVATAQLPDTDGVELFERLQAERPGLPFVLVHDSNDSSLASAAVDSGVSDCVRRPTTASEYDVVVNRIRNAVRAGREERTVEKQRQRIRDVLGSVPSCVVQLNREGEFVYANDRAKEVLGLVDSELAGRSYDDPAWQIRDLDGNPVPDAELPFRRVIDTASPVRNARHTITWPDGTERVLSVSGAPLTADSEVEGAVFSLTDETDRYRRAQRLAALHEATRDLYEAKTREAVARITSDAADSILDFELNGVHLYDEAAGGLAPTAVSDTTRETMDELVTFDHGIAWQTYQTGEVAAYGDIREAEEVYDPETDIRSGLYFPLDAHGVLVVSSKTSDDFDDHDLSLGKVLAANATSALDRVEQERALEALQQRTSALMNTSTVTETTDIAVRAAAGIIGANRSACFQLDHDEMRLSPSGVTDRIDGTFDSVDGFRRGDDGLAAFLWGVFDGQTPASVEDTDGHPRLAEQYPARCLLAYPISDGVFVFGATEPKAFDDTDRRLCAILTSSLDAAVERVRREAVLRERTQALADQNDRLDEFASVVAHDLRNPLQVLRGVLDAASADGGGEYVDRGETALDRMEALVEDVLTLAREDDSVQASEQVTLSAVAGDAWDLVDTGTATLSVATDCEFHADRDRIQRLLENLFRNAVEHAADTDRSDSAVAVTVGGLSDGIYVADDGRGIPPERRATVFESGYSDTVTGTGFGLAIVQRIADAHDWDTSLVESADGGVRIEFTGVEVA